MRSAVEQGPEEAVELGEQRARSVGLRDKFDHGGIGSSPDSCAQRGTLHRLEIPAGHGYPQLPTCGYVGVPGLPNRELHRQPVAGGRGVPLRIEILRANRVMCTIAVIVVVMITEATNRAT